MRELIQKLEVAVLRRNPSLAESLQPGLPLEKISAELKRAGIRGGTEPIIELYSWRNGATLQGTSDSFKIGLELGFVPPRTVELSEDIKQVLLLTHGVKRETDTEKYHFVPLKRATIAMRSFPDYAKHQPRLAIVLERYFPFLWNGSNDWIALDIEPSSHNRVVAIRIQEEQPLREAYDSFEDFLKDAVHANETNEPLACLRTPGKPITRASEGPAKPTAKAVAPKAGKIPATENPLVLRTDFSNEAAWRSLCKTLQDPDDEFSPELEFVSDRAFDGLAAADLPSSLSEPSPHTFAFIVDRTALTRAGNPVLIIDLHDKPGRTFRVTAAALGGVANNLSIANMDFDEFAKAVDKDGIFRGFSRA